MAGKARVHELAKELGQPSIVILAWLKDNGEFVKSASSTLEWKVARRVREAFPPESGGPRAAPLAAAAAQPPARSAPPVRQSPRPTSQPLKGGGKIRDVARRLRVHEARVLTFLAENGHRNLGPDSPIGAEIEDRISAAAAREGWPRTGPAVYASAGALTVTGLAARTGRSEATVMEWLRGRGNPIRSREDRVPEGEAAAFLRACAGKTPAVPVRRALSRPAAPAATGRPVPPADDRGQAARPTLRQAAYVCGVTVDQASHWLGGLSDSGWLSPDEVLALVKHCADRAVPSSGPFSGPVPVSDVCVVLGVREAQLLRWLSALGGAPHPGGAVVARTHVQAVLDAGLLGRRTDQASPPPAAARPPASPKSTPPADPPKPLQAQPPPAAPTPSPSRTIDRSAAGAPPVPPPTLVLPKETPRPLSPAATAPPATAPPPTAPPATAPAAEGLPAMAPEQWKNTDEPLRPSDPREVGDYTLLRRLGRGGMGAVYLARREGTSTDVALKSLLSELCEDDEARRRFERESDTLKRVSGEFTARVLDSGTDADRPYLVMERLEGTSLQHVGDTIGALPGDAVWAIALALAVALTALHDQDITHRDLKPSNVMVTTGGLKVIDFGIARLADGTKYTQTGSVVGSLQYMAPEQFIAKDPLTPAVDIYSWAGTVMFAATGKPPYPGETMPAVVGQILAGPPRGVGSLADPLLRDLLARAFAEDRTERPTPGELVARLAPEGDPAELRRLVRKPIRALLRTE